MCRRKTPFRTLVAFAALTYFLSASTLCAQVTLFSENFDGLALGDSVDEGVAGPVGDGGGTASTSVWTDIPPAGWTDDDSGVPGIGEASDNNGVFDWAGWNFADRDWWVTTAGDQRRSEFVNASGVVMVADADEWDDATHPGGAPDGPWYDTFISTPTISLTGANENSAVLEFDSSWRDEFDDNYHQTGNIMVSFDGGAAIEVLRLESDPASPNFYDDAPNDHFSVALNNPAGASEMAITFGLFDAGNDWWWAVDNIRVEAVPEPSASAMVLGAALLACGLYRRRGRA